MAKAVGVLMVLVSASCAAKSIPESVEGPSVTVGESELNVAVLDPAVTSTTATPTTTTQLVPATTVAPNPRRNSGIVEPSTTPANPALPYNGWAIPEYIISCETGGTFSWTAHNLSSDASGPYQLMPEHFGGALAMNQSRSAQHAKAAQLWNGGKGRANWQACL